MTVYTVTTTPQTVGIAGQLWLFSNGGTVNVFLSFGQRQEVLAPGASMDLIPGRDVTAVTQSGTAALTVTLRDVTHGTVSGGIGGGPRDALIQVRQGTAAQWAAVNPVLASGEPSLETDTRVEKTGDGVTAYNSLAASGGSSGGGSSSAQQMPAPTGVSATDCANFAAALAALPSTGGKIILQSRVGGNSYNFTNGVTINKPCEVEGQGGTNAIVGSIGKSDILCTSATANAITVTAPAVKFRGFSLRNTAGSAATAGAGILVSGGSNRDGLRYEGITVANFFVGINHQGGNNSWLRDCTLLNCISHEVIWDCGDSVISGNEFRRIGAADAGVGGYTQTGSNLLITTAQGVKIGDNKFLGGTGGTANDGTYCIEVTVPDGHLLLDTIIHDNSIEGYGNAGVWVRNAAGGTTGQVSRFQIQDNQFGTDASNYHVLITNSTASPNNFTHFIVDGNQFYGATHDVEITNCLGVLMGANESSVGNQQATLTNSTSVVKSTVVPGSFGGAFFPTDVAYATLVGGRLDAFELVIPFPFTATGIAMYVGALGVQGNMDAGLHNAAGVLLASCGNPSYTALTAAAVNVLSFTSPISLPAGTYWLSACSNYSGNTYGLVSQSVSRAIAKQVIAPTGPTASTLAGVSQLYAGRAGVSLVLA